ncbi:MULTISPECIES: GreA/GreB family elongation factor [Pedobacter]|uniref:Transcription elongation factor GreA/GreB domain protein n=1 Tax=Pedobacter heparinus (strain ATCC 13125 / DSM 2366 / CIP 104194 / JCM 7457 / NBRC 12017 / NCIMB 9290 / NRRL B-14731 / HIM 762-3) TaxID=485917 RepID=C6XWY5_PEDHD|nr:MULTISPECIES: GreA/GreB family elongation factor [Pedobacter]ACU04279.1 transcription elongation factor GreA/GreB domain protein [Pedobacter heparinus DSM 2366]MBB5440412.1 regulator of nucleoside diphosphate kinase [Pedobacter sp. AK017]
METKSLSLSKSDFKLLKEHLEKSNMSAYNKEKLQAELKAATIYTEEELPSDVVCLKSEARIANVKTGKEFTFKLVMPEEANIKAQKVSVFAPIGIALFGYRTGDSINWEMPDGIQEFKILEVNRL